MDQMKDQLILFTILIFLMFVTFGYILWLGL